MLVAAVIGGAAASILISQSGEIARNKQRKVAKNAAAFSAMDDLRYRRHTGIVGDESEITEILNHPESVVSVTQGVDSQGAPCLWLRLRNGAIYRSYDFKNPKIIIGH